MITYDVPADNTIYTIKEGSNYSFSDYFKLGFTPRAVAEYHGYTLERSYMQLDRVAVDEESVRSIQQRIVKGIPYVNTTNEMARREFMIAPIVFEVVIATHAEVSSEYQLDVSESLRGKLDYLLRATNKTTVVVEAKRDDLENGFAQLTAELIALDQWIDSPQTHIPGAVSTGTTWGFGILDRSSRTVHWDLTVYAVPQNIDQIVGVLTAALKN